MARKTKATKPAEPTKEEQAFEEHQNARQAKIKKLRKRLKWYHILAAVVVLFLVVLFLGWHVKPKKELNVVILDKTVFSYAEDEDIIKENIYRKHQGLSWLLNQQRYVKSGGGTYNYKTDYYGPVVDDEGEFDHERLLSTATSKPDLVYLSDGYGLGNDTFGHFDGGKPLNGGITSDDMSYISFAYENGAPIIAETALFSTPMDDSVKAQMSTLLGVTPTKWLGRYIVDLQDFSDVPDWAPPMYEQQEGVEWRFSGPGILLISYDGKIIVLEQNTDFDSKNLLRISINEKYKKEFKGCSKCNFYNWFELVEPNYGTENIATFEFDLNATGMEKIRDISNTPRFCAITRKQEKGYPPVYFFSGDFNDYVNGRRYGNFLFANQFFKFISFDRQGDISNFFWRFYNPLMRKILKDTKAKDYVPEKDKSKHKEVARINNGTFQIYDDEKWRKLNLKAMAINAQKPGEQGYSRDFTYYEGLLEQAQELGVNCLTAKTLLPPEFYTAVKRHNKNADEPIYIQQRISPPSGLSASDYLTEDGLAKWQETITQTVKALHGDGTAHVPGLGDATFFNDVSAYVLSVTVDPALDEKGLSTVKQLNTYSYAGDFTPSLSGAQGFAAYLYDTAQHASYDDYEYYTPVAVAMRMELVKGASFVKAKNAYAPATLADSDREMYFFNDIVIDNDAIEDLSGATRQDRYTAAFAELKKASPVILASGVSLADVNAVYGQEAVTEKQQGEGLIEILRATKDSGILGTVIYDLNDGWGEISAEMKPYTAENSSYLWHNTCDSKQRTGVVALDSVEPETPGLVLSDDDLVQAVSMSVDESYLYITLQLYTELDYKEQAMFVGLDTFQRNDGEYFYSKDFTHTSLSGMEYSLRFDEKQQAALYVMSSYDRSRGGLTTKESYTGSYNKVATLTYGSFTSGDNQFYQTGSTVYVRLPWTWLNAADPSKRLMINDKDYDGKQAKTVTTNGFLTSVMIGERKTHDLYYAFPQGKHDPGYKTFKWQPWEKATFALRQKESYGALKKYFTEN